MAGEREKKSKIKTGNSSKVWQAFSIVALVFVATAAAITARPLFTACNFPR